MRFISEQSISGEQLRRYRLGGTSLIQTQVAEMVDAIAQKMESENAGVVDVLYIRITATERKAEEAGGGTE